MYHCLYHCNIKIFLPKPFLVSLAWLYLHIVLHGRSCISCYYMVVYFCLFYALSLSVVFMYIPYSAVSEVMY